VKFRSRGFLGAAVVFLASAGGSALLLRAKSQRMSTADEASSVSSALHSLVYVGEAKCTSLESPAHSSEARPFPSAYVTDHCYVFHIPVSAPEELYSALEGYLTENGIKVTKAPRSAADFVYLMSGGPLFQIQFQQGQRHGTLTTLQHRRMRDPDPDLDATFRLEDLVLRFH
jgi:hypothetical protein